VTDPATLEQVKAYLARRLAPEDGEDLVVTAVRRIARGVSRESWRVETMSGRAGTVQARDYFIRCDYPGGVSVVAADLRFEYEVYLRLATSAVPVARPLWYDEHGIPGIIDRPLYVREGVTGDWRVPHFLDPDPGWDELRIQTSKDHLDHLALVHTCDYVSLGFPDIMQVPSGPEDAAVTALRYHESRLRSVADQPIPLVEQALRRLHATAPATASSVGLCKGTNGLGEEIFSGGRLVAMSDWELAIIGDPAYDWAQLQDFVPTVIRDGRQVWGEPQALAYYESVSGIHVEPATIDWYRAVNNLVKFTYTQNAVRALRAGLNASVRLAWVATEVRYRSERALAAIARIGEG
jgi:aminoglycoside phosphotransferase (APT) family kinase protein